MDFKTGVENYIFWSERGSREGQPHQELPGVPPGSRPIHRLDHLYSLRRS